MNHLTKSRILKILNILPSILGYKIYHLLQNFSGSNNLSYKIKSSSKSFETFQSICFKLKIELKNKSVLEIGSGWLPIIPYFFKYLGNLENVFTYDLNEHYENKKIKKLNKVFSDKYSVSIIPRFESKYSLPNGINYFPKQNIVHSKIPLVEIVFSRFVLEHVTPEDIYDMHKNFKNTLNKGSYIIHFISPSDHRAHSDKSLSLQDFLQYSESEWNSIQTKFDYHNRLRLPQYVEIFKKLNYEILYITSESVKQNSEQYKLFKKIKIHEDYKEYSENELTAGSINVVLKI